MESKRSMIESYKHYGFEFPLKAKYKRFDNRIYFATDFKDGEEISFFWDCITPTGCALGNAFYVNKEGISNLINFKELIPI